MQGAGEGSPQAAVLAAREALGLTRLEAFPVQHCAHAYGIVLESSSGWKVAVSGDTRPCPAVVEAALNATVLIHEVQCVIHFLSRWKDKGKGLSQPQREFLALACSTLAYIQAGSGM